MQPNQLINEQIGTTPTWRESAPLLPVKLQIVLNPSSNLFEGSITAVFARLTRLEVLDLSNNKFSVYIPDCFGSNANLDTVKAPTNRLSGIVPMFNSWVSVNIIGNSSSSPEQAKRRMPVAVVISMAFGASVLAAGIITIICYVPTFFE
ncbi:hypothetical protein Pint_07740 [Pistacia integerrima]|uniref:Uncharacterized protein n=1 Tax=Pistacia integerrima TaxID=434235 RepID=A0ACC0XWQ1_9ROSI|nr:hypothetical protein Pint_07740 [Pistacia integerrima]